MTQLHSDPQPAGSRAPEDPPTAPASATRRRRAAPAGPELGLVGWARWAWRTLTSMRTALILLALLALAAIPGSLLPQAGVNPERVAAYQRDHPALGSWLDRLGMFHVYSAPWFAAVYLLLLISMTGCVLPRSARLWRAVRAAPPRAPSNLTRLAGHRRWETDQPVGELLAGAAAELRHRRYRVLVDGEQVRAEAGQLREVGNLLFHLSTLVLLFGVAAGKLYGFEGRVIVAEGAGFANVRSQYDEFNLRRRSKLGPARIGAPLGLPSSARGASCESGGRADRGGRGGDDRTSSYAEVIQNARPRATAGRRRSSVPWAHRSMRYTSLPMSRTITPWSERTHGRSVSWTLLAYAWSS